MREKPTVRRDLLGRRQSAGEWFCVKHPISHVVCLMTCWRCAGCTPQPSLSGLGRLPVVRMSVPRLPRVVSGRGSGGLLNTLHAGL